MNFKECVRRDIYAAFLDIDGFCEIHKVNNKDNVRVVIDDYELLNREKFRKEVKSDGTSVNRTVLYVKAVDFGRLPKEGSRVMIDDSPYFVESATNEFGLYALTIHAVK